MGRFATSFESLYRSMREDIFVLCAAMNFSPTQQQREILEQVQRCPRRMAIKSGHGCGKTAISVIVAVWRVLRDVNALVVVMAPTMRQARNWLSEARKLLDASDPVLRRLLDVTASQIKVCGKMDWGVRLVTGTKTENVAGIHRDNLTFIMDEASGIKREIFEAIEGTLTNEDALLFLIGNPTNRDGTFFECFNAQRHRWLCMTLNAERSPIVTRENIVYFADKFGENSDVYRIRILGEFPHQDPCSVMSSEDLYKCTKEGGRSAIEAMRICDFDDEFPGRQIGYDFARMGSDESTIFQRSGLAIVDWDHFSHVEPGHVVRHGFRMQARARWKNDECVHVPDATGMGQGVMHLFYDADRLVHEFHNHGKPFDSTYDNKVTEAWFLFGELCKKVQPFIPNDNRLIHQLSTRQYYTTTKGKLCLESKDDFVKRSTDDIGSSPDRADGLITCYYPHARPRGQVLRRGA